ncbi:MAG: electron transfer flavoprotein subunit beta/FixA family protein [Bacteroidota bacterium]|nr:electron transfer flavoprotein subunit beta/FixA family protein [Bacteroidota bacterium]
MKLLVCISNVPDTTTKVRFADNQTRFDATGVQWIINPWDELALTRAVDLKEDSNNPVSEVVVINVGSVETEPTLRKCLAIGADKAIRIDTVPKDAFQTAKQIASLAQKNAFDFIICGIESGDYNSSSVGGMIAEFLDTVSVSSVSDIQFQEGKAIVERDVAAGKEYIQMEGNAVLIVQKGFAKEPKIPNMRGIMMARQKPLEVIPANDANALTEYIGFQLPEPKAKVKMVNADQMTELVNFLSKEAKVL